MKEIKCLNCNTIIEDYDIIDTDYTMSNLVEIGWCTCPKCNKTFELDVVYKFSHFVVGEEMKED